MRIHGGRLTRFVIAPVVLVIGMAGCSSTTTPDPSASPSPSAIAASLDSRPVQEQLVDAVVTSDVALAALALDAGADPSLYDPATNNGPLRLAITRDDVEMVELLVEAGARVEWPEFNYSELEGAAQFAGGEVIDALLATGASPDGVGERVGAPLSFAAYANNAAVVAALLNAGADPNALYGDGANAYPPLFSAAYGGAPDTALLLIQAGADVTVRDPNGAAPSDWADSQGYEDVGTLLRNFGA